MHAPKRQLVSSSKEEVPVRRGFLMSVFGSALVSALSCAVSLEAGGATNDEELLLPAQIQSPLQMMKATTRKKRPAPPIREKSRFSLVIPTVVYHGIKPDESVAGEMNRKLDGDGRAVVTPGIGISYEGGHGGLLALLAGFKDCYDGLAGTLQLGQTFKVSQETSWGYTLGLYVRETPMTCEAVTNYESVNGGPGRPSSIRISTAQECSSFDNYPWKSVAILNGEPIDIIPMPFLHFSTALYKDEGLQIDLKFMTNYVLNEVGIGIPF